MYWLPTLVKKDFLLFFIFTYTYILVLNCPTLHTINIIVDCRLFLMATCSNNHFYHLSLNGFRTWLIAGHKSGLTIYNGTDSIGGRMWQNNKHTLEARSGEGNGNPLQCSCLENPRDGWPGGLPSVGSHRVGHNWRDLVAAAAETRRDLVAGLFSGQVSVLKQSVSLIFMALGPMDLQGSEDRIHGLYLSASVYISVCRLSSN